MQEWENDPHTTMVIMKGAGGKAFCAGGDIRGKKKEEKRRKTLLFRIYTLVFCGFFFKSLQCQMI